MQTPAQKGQNLRPEICMGQSLGMSSKAPGWHLWAESYEGDLHDTLALQKKVASAIAEQIRIELTPKEQAVLKNARVVNPEAYESYLLSSTPIWQNSSSWRTLMTNPYDRAARQSKWTPILLSHTINSRRRTSENTCTTKRSQNCGKRSSFLRVARRA